MLFLMVSLKQNLGGYFDKFLVALQPRRMELRDIYSNFFSGADGRMLDIGCGRGNHLDGVEFNVNLIRIGLDSHKASLDFALAAGRYNEIICADAGSHLAKCADKSYEYVLASCVIEHLEKMDGLLLLAEMERIASKGVIVFTPNGFVPQPPDPDNPANEHKSGWTVTTFRKRGYMVENGLYGLKWLRTSFGEPKIRPKILGDLVAKSTARLVWLVPSMAYQIVAIKICD